MNAILSLLGRPLTWLVKWLGIYWLISRAQEARALRRVNAILAKQLDIASGRPATPAEIQEKMERGEM